MTGEGADIDYETLAEIERRILWLAVRMVDSANHDRPDGQIKVGGHQASSTSIVSLMTALYFCALGPNDRVAVKPHASPIFHAIQYLIGGLDRSYLTTLRELGGLQAYPSRTKDPDLVDYSTGSVGLGVVATLFGAAVRRYVDEHFREADATAGGRYIALVGDAELDEGNIWEAVVDPATQGLGNAMWVVDLNRQSLDRVVPGIKAHRLMDMFRVNGWNVEEVKYGRRLLDAFDEPGGGALRRQIDEMSNEHYQSLFGLAATPALLRERFLDGASRGLAKFCRDIPDDELATLVLNLGGHDLRELVAAYRRAADVDDRPTVVFAYTIKGWGLPFAGDPMNHAAVLSEPQIDELRTEIGLTPATEWDRFEDDSTAGRWCTQIGSALLDHRTEAVVTAPVIPESLGAAVPAMSSTQESFGRLLMRLADHPELGPRTVTASPDVAVSTNLGGWINKVGVFAPTEQTDWLDGDRLLAWKQSPKGQHIELGISEMNLFLLLGQLGLSAEHTGELLFPIGTVYDPFVLRGLDAFIYGPYSAARFVLVGTPSGLSLSYEGGAHQSLATPSVGLELPGVTIAEPAYGRAVDWLLCDGLDRVVDRAGGESMYLRLTTRPIDQRPFDAALERLGEERLRHDVVAGAYRLREPADGAGAAVYLAASGALMPEALAAGEILDGEGVPACVIDVTALGRLYREWSSSRKAAIRHGAHLVDDHHLGAVVPPSDRALPIVTVHDAHPHAMAWLGSVFGAPQVALGPEDFGQSGAIDDVYAAYDLQPDAIVNAALTLAAG